MRREGNDSEAEEPLLEAEAGEKIGCLLLLMVPLPHSKLAGQPKPGPATAKVLEPVSRRAWYVWVAWCGQMPAQAEKTKLESNPVTHLTIPRKQVGLIHTTKAVPPTVTEIV